MPENKRKSGEIKESFVVSYLEEKGYQILDRNFHSRFGEIDIIASLDEVCVFIEVKYRKENTYGRPEQAVGYRKRKRIIKTADYYRITHGMSDHCSCRFDIVAVTGDEIVHYENAFDYRGM